MKILTQLIDSLDLRLILPSPCLSPEFRSHIPAWRAYKLSPIFGIPLFIDIPGIGSFRLHRGSSFPYEFTLINSEICDIRIFNPDSFASPQARNTGQIYLNFRSNWLFFNQDRILSFCADLLRFLCGTQESSFIPLVSRIDLAVDIAGFELRQSHIKNFVSRARLKDHPCEDPRDRLNFLLSSAIPSKPPERSQGVAPQSDNRGGAICSEDSVILSAQAFGEIQKIISEASSAGSDRLIFRKKLQTAYFGRKGSPIFCRIYDKHASLDKQGKEFLRDHWAQLGWDGHDPVWRTEFSFSGDFLRDSISLFSSPFDRFGDQAPDIRDFRLLFACLPELWQYATTRWLRHIVPDHSSRSRSSVSPFWQLIQSAFPSALAIFRIPRRRTLCLENLQAQIRGCLFSWAAKFTSVRGFQGLATLAHEFSKFTIDLVDSPSFLSDLCDRISDLGLSKFDYHFDSQLRIDSGLFSSDTHFSALLRDRAIRLYGGS